VQTVLGSATRGVRVVGVADGTVSSQFSASTRFRRERGSDCYPSEMARGRRDPARHDHSISFGFSGRMKRRSRTRLKRRNFPTTRFGSTRNAPPNHSPRRKRRQGIVLLGKARRLFHLVAPSALGELLGRCRVTLLDGPTTADFWRRPVGV